MNFYQSSLLALCFICSSALAQTQYTDVLLTQLQPTAEDAIWSRTKDTTPLYPVEMARTGIVGCAVFRHDLDQQGKNQKIELVNSVPAKGLNKHATKLIKN
jgi:outer membrane biosynthesis protein TonB